MFKYKTVLAGTLISALALAGCDQPVSPTADQKDQAEQENITSQAVAQVPLPTITHFMARRTLKMAMEAEDQELPTYSYNYNPYKSCYVPLGGDAHTYGYPIPGATEMTNPQKVINYSNGGGANTLPQADPDTTFKPSSENATLVLQQDAKTGNMTVTYSEPDVITKTSPIDPQFICKPNN